MSDYPQTAVSHIVRTQHLYFAQRDTTPACFGPFATILKLLLVGFTGRFGSQGNLNGTLYILSILQGLDG